MERKFRGLFIAAAFLAAAPAAGLAGNTEALSLVPEDAVVVVAAPSLAGFEESIGFFADAVAPGTSMTVSEAIIKLYTFDTGVRDGLDVTSPAAAFVLLGERPREESPEAAAAEAGTSEKEPGEEGFAAAASPVENIAPRIVLLLPLADEETWRSAMGEKIARSEGAAYEHIAGAFRPEAYFTVRDGFVAAADTQEALDAWSRALGGGLSDARKTNIRNALARAPVAVEFSVKTLLRLRPGVLDALNVESIPLPPGKESQAAKVQLSVLARAAREMAENADSVILEVRPSTAGITLAVNIDAVEESLFGEAFAAQRPVDLSVLSSLPSDSFAFGAMRMEGGPLFSYLGDLNAAMIKALAGDEETLDVEAALDLYNGIIDDLQRYGLFANTAFALERGETYAMNILAIHATPQAQEALEMLSAGMKAVYANPVGMKIQALSGFKPQEPEITEDTIAGHAVKVIRQQLGGEEVPLESSRAIEFMYGAPVTTRMAAGDEVIYLTIGKDDTLMRRVLEGTVAPVSADVVERSLAPLSGTPSWAVFVSAPDLALLGMTMVQVVNEGSASMPAVDLPPASQLVAAAASFEGSTARLEVNVPVEQINAAKAAFMQIMMMRMQEGMEGGPVPGLTTDQPPAPWESQTE